MAYFTHNSRARESGFEYAPVPNANTGLHSTLDANDGFQLRAPEHLTSNHPYFSPSHDAQAMASSTANPHHFSPDPGLEVPMLRRIAPALSPALSLEHGISASQAVMVHTRSSAHTKTTKFVSYSAEDFHKKRPRGTTGSVVCDKCGSKFTVISSLNRHNRISHGKKPAKKSTSTQRKIAKTKDSPLTADLSDHDSRTIETNSILSEDQSQVVRLNSNLHTIPPASMIVSAESRNLILDPTTINSHLPKPFSTQTYTPRGWDTSLDHHYFFCDLCPEVFARREILQMHKSNIHGLTEIPYFPDSGTIDRPSYLTGVTLENATKHSRMALKTWEWGGLSTSPCQPCISKGLYCIVNPFASSKCSYCNNRDDGSYCGAAGVGYS